MNKGQFILGKKVIALLLLIVVLSSYMPINLVYGVSDTISSEPETNTVVENTTQINETVNNVKLEEIIDDTPKEQTNNVVESTDESVKSTVPVVEDTKNENQDFLESNSEDNVVVGSDAKKDAEIKLEQEENIQNELSKQEEQVENTTEEIGNNNFIEEDNIKGAMVNGIEISGNLTWIDNQNSYGTRPSVVTINLFKNAGTILVSSTSVTSDSEGNWNYKFENLEKYDENETLIDYQVIEDGIISYEVIQEGTNFVNKLVEKTDLNGTITWDDQENRDAMRPEMIYISVLENGNKASAKSYAISADENENWNYTFEDLEKYDENGIIINYSIIVNEIENYKSIVEKVNQNQFNIKNVYSPKKEADLTWEEILSYGPYMSMNIKYAEEYGLDVSQEEMYIYEKYQEMIFVKGPELATIAMFEGTEGFTEEELAIYNAYQEIVLNGGEKSPVSTLAEIGNTGNAIKSDGTPILEYFCCYGMTIPNSIKYVTSVDKNAPEAGNRVAYCINYNRAYDNSATYDESSWNTITREYESVYSRLYSEISYIVSIGCKEYGSHNNSNYSTGGDWVEDYYATQTAIYNVIYDYTGYKNPRNNEYDTSSLGTLQQILKKIKAEDSNALKDINPDNIDDVIKVADRIRETFTGHPGGDQIALNQDYSGYQRAQNVKDAVGKIYSEVTYYRNNKYSLDNADGNVASIEIKNVSDFNFIEKENGESYYEVVVTVETKGKVNGEIKVTATGSEFSVEGTKFGSSNQYKIIIPKNKIGNKKEFTFTASVNFDVSRTITYISKVEGKQNVAFYQTNVEEDGLKIASITETGPTTGTINGTKVWKDNNNQYGTRPTSITIKLLSGNTVLETKTITPDAAGNWSWSFTNYPNQTGYTIEEKSIENYAQAVNGYNVTNTLTDTTEISVTKKWKDNSNKYYTRPNEITVNLFRNGTVLKSEKLTDVNKIDENTWKYTFTELEKYDSNGKLYEYTVEEEPIKSAKTEVGTYKSKVEGTTIINTLVGKVELGGEKIWKDNNNAYGTRPDSIIVNLFANGEKVQNKEVTKGELGNWTFFFANLVKFDEEGKKIEYSISENDVINYIGKVEGTNITNTLTGTTEIKGIKIWHDSDNDYETRPESIIVKLLANGKEIAKKTVKADENGEWKFAFEDLDEYDSNGVKIEYTVEENPVDRYVTDIKGTTIINTLIHNNITLTNLDSTPKTGKKNLLTVFSLTALMSLVGMFIVSKKEDKF